WEEGGSRRSWQLPSVGNREWDLYGGATAELDDETGGRAARRRRRRTRVSCCVLLRVRLGPARVGQLRLVLGMSSGRRITAIIGIHTARRFGRQRRFDRATQQDRKELIRGTADFARAADHDPQR